MTLSATVRDGVVVPNDPARLPPDGTPVEIHVAPNPQPANALGLALLALAGTAPGLPEDLAAQHDHYLHGTPKR